MNAELSKIRLLKNKSEEMDSDTIKLEEGPLNKKILKLNYNITYLYNMIRKDCVDINEFINRLTENIYVVLTMFDEMGVYPDYFYDEIVKMNLNYKLNIDNNNRLQGNYRLFKQNELSSRIGELIKSGKEHGYGKISNYPGKDIENAYSNMIAFFDIFHIPHNIRTVEQCKEAFNEIKYNYQNIMQDLGNSDYDYEDIEYFSRLLFEFLSFFVSIGVNPKEYLDEYIEKHAKEEGKVPRR